MTGEKNCGRCSQATTTAYLEREGLIFCQRFECYVTKEHDGEDCFERGDEPCPFCKSENIDVEREADNWFCRCVTCESRGPTTKSKQDARIYWNAR